MDVLTDLLHSAGLRRRLLDLRRLSAPMALRFPCEKSMGLHIVTRGRLYVHAPTLPEPLALQTGDIAVMARGCTHVVSTQADLRGLKIEPCVISSSAESVSDLVDPDVSTVIGGAYQFWNDPVHPFFGQMPSWFVVRAATLPRLGSLSMTLAMLDEEVRKRELGSETIVHALLDVVFTLLLRAMVEQEGQAGASWSHGVRDPQVRQAVVLMHDDCAHPWTLDELAERAGLSRTSLAVRFRDAMGDTPLSYLRSVRMQKAMSLLSETDKNLDQVATEVGYRDAFSFSKVFKRCVGSAPKEFRRRDTADKNLAWRLPSAQAR